MSRDSRRGKVFLASLIQKILCQERFSAANASALLALADITRLFIENVACDSKRFCEHNRRSECNAVDVMRALRRFPGLQPSDLKTFRKYERPRTHILTSGDLHLGGATQSVLDGRDPRAPPVPEDNADRSANRLSVPSYLPPFPPARTFRTQRPSFTEHLLGTEKETEMIRTGGGVKQDQELKATKTMRSAKRSLDGAIERLLLAENRCSACGRELPRPVNYDSTVQPFSPVDSVPEFASKGAEIRPAASSSSSASSSALAAPSERTNSFMTLAPPELVACSREGSSLPLHWSEAAPARRRRRPNLTMECAKTKKPDAPSSQGGESAAGSSSSLPSVATAAVSAVASAAAPSQSAVARSSSQDPPVPMLPTAPSEGSSAVSAAAAHSQPPPARGDDRRVRDVTNAEWRKQRFAEVMGGEKVVEG